jgi:serine/threonine protein kinase
VFHADIKPENLLVDLDGTVKISDFGVSMIVGKTDGTIQCTKGTPAFLAPETTCKVF